MLRHWGTMKETIGSLLKFSLLCGIISFHLAASAQCKFTTLTIPGSTADTAIGINDQGAIVGGVEDSTGNHGFLLFQGKVHKFDFPGAFSTEALGINNHGQIVGDYDAGQFAKAGQSGFVVHNGVFQAISDPKAPGATRAIGINNFSVIVGSAGLDGFVLRNGKFTTIHFPGSSRTAAHAINDSGVIVGVYGDSIGFNHAFMLKNGKYTNVDFPGSSNSSANGIDNEGDVTGSYDVNSGDEHGFTLDKGRYLTHDDPNASLSTVIFGVNSHDQLVGGFVDASGHNHSFKANCSGVF
ncbi:MAG TPA: hypothetical protein VN872_11805 [Candidatus Acidoferrum sp.]|nr:hypothetical protein [Candidatus Acidoferrum sp.]